LFSQYTESPKIGLGVMAPDKSATEAISYLKYIWGDLCRYVISKRAREQRATQKREKTKSRRSVSPQQTETLPTKRVRRRSQRQYSMDYYDSGDDEDDEEEYVSEAEYRKYQAAASREVLKDDDDDDVNSAEDDEEAEEKEEDDMASCKENIAPNRGKSSSPTKRKSPTSPKGEGSAKKRKSTWDK